MKAAVLYGKEDIRYEDVEMPKVVPGHVKVRVKACGICGSDIPRYFEGRVHNFPLILGHEISGVVDEVASDIKDICCGDHVAVVPLLPCFNCESCSKGNYSLCSNYSFLGSRCSGGMSDFVLVPRKNIVIVDKNIPFEKAAFFEVSTVALHALKLVNFEGGYPVLVIGTGTVGLMTIQWAKLLGAQKVIAVGRNKKTFALAKKLGASKILDSGSVNFAEQLLTVCKEYGFKFVFEAVGAEETINMAYMAAMRKAKICLIGTPRKELVFSAKNWELLNRKEVTVTGSWMSYSAPFPGEEWYLTERYMSEGKFVIPNEMIHKTYKLEQASEAFDVFKSEDVVGRVLIVNEGP